MDSFWHNFRAFRRQCWGLNKRQRLALANDVRGGIPLAMARLVEATAQHVKREG